MQSARSGRFVWLLSAALFLLAMGLAGWLIRSSRVGTASLTDIADWTPRQVMASPDRFVDLCRTRLDAIAVEIAASRTRLQEAQANARGLDLELQARLRVATQRHTEIKAVYAFAEAGHRWPVHYAGLDLDRHGLQARLVGKTRYIQALAQASARMPGALAEIDRRLQGLANMDSAATRTRQQIESLGPLKKPLGDELLDRLVKIGAQVANLQGAAPQLTQPIPMDLPCEADPGSFDPREVTRALADTR